MKSTMKFKQIAAAIVLAACIGQPAYAQIKIKPGASGAALPDGSAALDLSSFDNKGLLMPKVALSSSGDAAAIASPAEGLVVYCTGTAGLAKGLYVNKGTTGSPSWTLLEGGGSSSAIYGGTINCSPGGGLSLTGGAYQGVAMSVLSSYPTGYKKTISLEASAGSYFISSSLVSGLKLSASGNFTSDGTQTVDLILSGTPTTLGTISLPLTVSGVSGSCTTSVTVTAPLSLNCAGKSWSWTSPGGYTETTLLINGTSYSGTLTVPYTAGAAGAILAAETYTLSGLTLSRADLTLAASGNITYTLSGTYTGTSGSLIYTINPGATCAVAVGDGPAFPLSTTAGVLPQMCDGKTISHSPCGASTVTSVNGVVYPTVTMSGTISGITYFQCWLRENLRDKPAVGTAKARSGVVYRSAASQATINADTTVNGMMDTKMYGLGYNDSAAYNNARAERAQGLCPTGYHIPSDCEWMGLEALMGIDTTNLKVTGVRGAGVGTALKVVSPTTFSAIMCGYNNSGTACSGAMNLVSGTTWVYMTSYSGACAALAISRLMAVGATTVDRGGSSLNILYAAPVRCLKD